MTDATGLVQVYIHETKLGVFYLSLSPHPDNHAAYWALRRRFGATFADGPESHDRNETLRWAADRRLLVLDPGRAGERHHGRTLREVPHDGEQQ